MEIATGHEQCNANLTKGQEISEAIFLSSIHIKYEQKYHKEFSLACKIGQKRNYLNQIKCPIIIKARAEIHKIFLYVF